MPDDIRIRHIEDEHRFETEIDGLLAHVDYEIHETLMTITHTWVPPELRGKNLAAQLVQTALDDARKRQLKVVPQCSYVAHYIARHPGYADLLA